MTILLAILKILGVLLLVLLLLLLAALLLPLGLDIRYKAGRWQVQARYAMLHFTLYPPKSAPQQAQSPAPETPPKSPPAAEKPNPPPATEAEPAQNTPLPETQEPPQKQPPEPKPAAKAKAKPTPEKAGSGLPFGIRERLAAAEELLQKDPAAFVKCAFGHLGRLGRGLAKNLRLCHVTVFWTVTAEDAAATAVSYGALLGAVNTAWALLQQSVRVQADSLRLEPDFTGQQKANRCISLQVRSCAAVLLWLALRFARRLYKEPLWQPQKQETC